MNWQPIQTAPQTEDVNMLGFGVCPDNGKLVGIISLVRRHYDDGPRAEWEFNEGAYSYDSDQIIRYWQLHDDVKITHWAPLLNLPESSE